jgi:hypothetical protein
MSGLPFLVLDLYLLLIPANKKDTQLHYRLHFGQLLLAFVDAGLQAVKQVLGFRRTFLLAWRDRGTKIQTALLPLGEGTFP